MRAPEFPHDVRWLNSSPLNMKAMREKKVVLVDFWTYSCVNCLRTLPHVKKWHETYAPFGLVVVGIHTPEFEFEKNLENVSRAAKRLGIEYPVAIDNDYQVWSSYSNNVWPREFLINKDGQIVHDHAGEGGYKETEMAIRAALLELNPQLELPDIIVDPSTTLGTSKVCLPATPETYLGAMRGHQGKTWGAVGEWRAYQEYIEHAQTTDDFSDCLTLNFEAAEVNLVMEARTERPAKIRLELNGVFLREIDVREPRLYNLLLPRDIAHDGLHKTAHRGELKVFVKDKGVRMYAFTFGGCA